MIGRGSTRGLLLLASCTLFTVAGCAFQGLNSLPLPGVVGHGAGASVYHVEFTNVGTLESNSAVTVDDVTVGSITKMTVQGWHADVEVSVKPDVVIPANAVATVGQTSLLGSMHITFGPPLGQPPAGRLKPGATIPLNRSSSYPSTERTLSSVAAVVNGGGLGQVGEIIHNFNGALSGHQDQIRDLLSRLKTVVGVLDQQRGNIVASIEGLNRLSGSVAGQQDVITDALQRIPPALDVLIKERPRITTALEKLGVFADTTTGLVRDTQADLVRNLKNLEPAIRAMADVGPDLDTVLAYAPTFPFTQDFIDRAIRGDYINFFINFDITVPRFKNSLLLGTRLGQEGLPLVPAPGDPWYLNYSYDPIGSPLKPPPAVAPPPDASGPPAPDASTPPPTHPSLPPSYEPPMDVGGR